MQDTAVIYYSHYVSDAIVFELKRLKQGCPYFDIHCVGCCEDPAALSSLDIPGVVTHAFLRDELRELPYPERINDTDWTTMRGSPDLALLAFFRKNPTYSRYYIIENDVRFSGRWERIFADLERSAADLLAIHVTPYAYFQDWIYWDKMKFGASSVDLQNAIRVFLPFCRISNTLFQMIDSACMNGWSGHPEGLWPTVAVNNGLEIEEIGGNGEFVPAARRGRYYFSAFVDSCFLSTFTTWPFWSARSNIDEGSLPVDTLWHPVKE